jgi:protein-disulfide isomerase
MASRTKQKEEARARRLAEERARLERARRQRRLQMIGGVVLGAIAVVAVAIAVSSGGSSSAAPKPDSASAKQAAATVASLLAGIPQSGNRLGSPTAKITVTEFGDLQCPVCKDFALGAQNQLISNDVRSGKVQLIYRSLATATQNGPDPSVFPTQQAAALAAGQQQLGWNYVELFYHEQGPENTAYVTDSYLNGLARQIPALNYNKWLSDRTSSSLPAQVTQDQQLAASKGFTSTPTIVVQGTKGTAQPIVGNTDYGTLESAIKSVM